MAKHALLTWMSIKPRMMLGFIVLGVIVIMMITDMALAGETTTTVTTYVVRTQEEREQTRWTLTEWLRVKERMKLMDVWLAMFSDPKKDQFRPEVNVTAFATNASVQRKVNEALTDSGTSRGQTIRAQVFLTNLVSSKIGIRTLNIDLGVEAGARDSGPIEFSSATPSSAISQGSRSVASNYYCLDLRIFGKHIQDSSLVLKYGNFNFNHFIYKDLASDGNSLTIANTDGRGTGSTAGVELQLYLLKSFGLEGAIFSRRAELMASPDRTLSGTYGEGIGFVEFGVLRMQGGVYEERWQSRWNEQNIMTIERGYLGGIKILL